MSEVIQEVPSQAELDRHFAAMGDSVDLINAIVAGTQMISGSVNEKKDCVKRNVDHLELMVAKGWFDSFDLSAVNQAIAVGTAYLVNP
jgi:hypothetical protein